MAEMQAIADKYDIGAVIVIHTPMHSEYYLGLSPTYSGIKFNGTELRVRIKQEDFKTQQEFIDKLKNTSNMVEHLTNVTSALGEHLVQIRDVVSKNIKAEHTGGHHTSQQELDN